MVDTGPRAQARKELRNYDNPKNGRNLNFKNGEYLNAILKKYNMSEVELRKWVLERTRNGKRA
jgi:Mor family transcriptional regulator